MSRVPNHVHRCSSDHKLFIFPCEIDAGVGIRSRRDVWSAAFCSSLTPCPQTAETIVACGLQWRPNPTFTSITILPSRLSNNARRRPLVRLHPLVSETRQFCTWELHLLLLKIKGSSIVYACGTVTFFIWLPKKFVDVMCVCVLSTQKWEKLYFLM